MKEYETETIVQLRKVLLEMLVEIDRICKENGITYFIYSGTLLGAVRHKGFIPWDDDLDIAMFRDDYNRFIEVCKNNRDSDYFIQCIETDKKYWRSAAKFRKKHTLYDDISTRKTETDRGIFIDVFPLDNANHPDDFWQTVRANIYKQVLARMICYKYVYRRKKKRFGLMKVIKILLIPIPLNWLLRAQKYLATYNRDENSEFLFSLGGTYHYIKQIIPRDCYQPTVKLEFEGKFFDAPNGYEYYLNRIYGSDYMALPPEHKRVAHAPEQIIFDTRID